MSPRKLLAAILANRKSKAGLYLVTAFVIVAIFGPLFCADPKAFLSLPLSPPSTKHWFGTNGMGQDVFAQTIVGSRPTLLIAFIAGVSITCIGAFIGASAAYIGGKYDDIVSLMINVFLVIPGLPLMIVMAAFFPPGPLSILFVLVFTGWAWQARVIRAQTLTLRSRGFVDAAKLSGESTFRIVVIEILPNMFSLLASAFIGTTVYAIGAQVGLEFIGLGDVSQVTWGTNLYWASNDLALLTGSWWTFLPTGLCIALVGFGLTLINFGIDEITNPRLRSLRIWKQRLGPTVQEGWTPVEKL